MSSVHAAFGYFVVGVFAVMWLWGFGAKLIRRDPGVWFWRWLVVAQIAVVVQVLAGATLFLMGRRQPLLHYAYGVFPVLALLAAHVYARRTEREPWLAFSVAAFVSFGLVLRALMTGLGFA